MGESVAPGVQAPALLGDPSLLGELVECVGDAPCNRLGVWILCIITSIPFDIKTPIHGRFGYNSPKWECEFDTDHLDTLQTKFVETCSHVFYFFPENWVVIVSCYIGALM